MDVGIVSLRQVWWLCRGGSSVAGVVNRMGCVDAEGKIWDMMRSRVMVLLWRLLVGRSVVLVIFASVPCLCVVVLSR